MLLHELTTLLTHLSGDLKLGYETAAILPVVNVHDTQNTLLLQTSTPDAPAMTVRQFQKQTRQLAPTQLLKTASYQRVYGFRQVDNWLLFK